MELNKDEVCREHVDATRLAIAGLAGLGVFTAGVAALHVIDHGRDPVAITVSEYVLGPYGWLLTIAAAAFGLGILGLTGALAARLPSPRPRAGLTLMALAGIGMVLVAAFPTDPIDPTDPRFVTTAGAIHAAAGITAFTCLAAAAPLLGRRVAAATGTAATRLLAWLPPVGYALFWTTGLLDNQLGGLFDDRSATGLGERAMAVTFLVWLTAAGVAVVRARVRGGVH